MTMTHELTRTERKAWSKAVRRHLKLAERLERVDPSNFDMASWFSGTVERHGQTILIALRQADIDA